MEWSFLMFRLVKKLFTQKGVDAEKSVARATKFCTVVPNICGFSALNLRVTVLTPRILTWFVGSGEVCGAP
jgi:hypothetical protein